MTAAACDVQLAGSEVQDVHMKRLDVGADIHVDAGQSTLEDGVLKPTSLLSGTELAGILSPPTIRGTEKNCIIDRSSCTQCRASVGTVHVVLLSCVLGIAMVRSPRITNANNTNDTMCLRIG